MPSSATPVRPLPSSPSAPALAVAASVLLAVTVQACGDAGFGGAGPPTVRDSAGVTVVEHPERAPRAERVSGEPDVVIGRQGVAPYELVRVGPVEPLASGNVVVAELASNELRFYDSEGAHVRTVQGRRSGSAAFGVASALWSRADTLIVVDQRLQRLVYFDTAGSFIRGRSYSSVFAPERPGEGPVCALPSLAGLMADGTRVAWGWNCVEGGEGEGMRPSRSTLRLIRAGGRDSVGTFTTSYVWTPGASPDSWVVPPFAPRVSLAVGDDRIYLSRGERYRIEVYDGSGRLVRILAEEGDPPDVGEGDREAFREGAAPGYPAEAGFPESFPAYVQLLLADDGELWALRHPGEGEDRLVWTVYSPDGERRRRVELPALSWWAVGGDRVWGVRVLSRNEARVVAYDLAR